ncbi:hypothetical protein A0J61_05160 [Choanephora cucurbitarum]|uniref:F-box domain-containing protein n=1 Tax=Choanephora cucurbitarum TaxID=101091 RepID=A0A1C7NCV4_9FUNG|nr:hypothetical protein A0J61_05160 [Choanephora cucurbitarum]
MSEQLTLLGLPYDIITNISQRLDLCSNTSLMDTCRHFRYMFLSSTFIWRRISFHLDHTTDLHRVYSSLRKLGDSNGLRQHVREVMMDDNDDSNFSPIIMLIKFPNLRKLSAKNRKENTNLEVDIKILQEMLKFGSVKPKSLPIEKLSIYHYYMDFEPHLLAYQKTWNKLSMHPHVELDIRTCGYLPEDQKENELERELSLLEQRIQRLQMQQDITQRLTPSLTEHQPVQRCQRIVCTTASCWSCGDPFESCWKCVPVCAGCGIRRTPPIANDNQRRLKAKSKAMSSTAALNEDDDFSVFE